MKICLTEIERCQKVTPRPNFIILLGDRFGWRPLPYAIPADEFEIIAAILAGQPLPGKGNRSFSSFFPNISNCFRHSNESAVIPTHDNPFAYRLLQEWYRLDENAVPPEYILLPRQKGSRYEDYTTWECEVERTLMDALEQAARQAGLNEHSLVKYTHSATGQEIIQGALSVADADEHVFGFFRTIENIQELKKLGQASEYLDADPKLRERQRSLRGKLTRQLAGNICEFQTGWDGEALSTDYIGSLPETLDDCLKLNESSQSPQSLCEATWFQLSQVILAQVGQFETIDVLQNEVQAHAEFGQERARFFIGRTELLQKIANYLDDTANRPMTIWGDAGTGKSALLARSIQQAKARSDGRPVVITRFIGATPDSADIHMLLESLCRQITRAYGGDENNIPVTYPELVQMWPKHLGLVTSDKPAWLFLDALDQLSAVDNARSLAWLPKELPANVKMVVSTVSGECKDILERIGTILLPLTGLKPGEGSVLLDDWLANSHRRLTEAQHAHILAKFTEAGRLPLYLKLAFEEARRWHSYDDLPEMSDQKPGFSSNISGVIRDLFFRLSQESQHGEKLVSRALGYLAAGKNGLTEDELLEVLWQDKQVQENFFQRSPKSPKDVQALPVVVWSRFFMDIEPYLIEQNADETRTLSFYHRQIREAVQEMYLGGKECIERHCMLADYFANKPLQHATSAGSVYNIRKLSELPFHQAGGRRWTQLKTTLLDYSFLLAKNMAIGVRALVEDYNLFNEKDPASSLPSFINILHRALRQATHVLAQDPGQLPSQLWGRLCDHEEPELQTLLHQAIKEHPKLWLRPRIPSLSENNTLLRTLAGHTNLISSIAVTANGSIAVSASWDQVLKVWDLNSGQEVGTLQGHTGYVNSVAVTPDGRLAISASSDNTLKVWDLASNIELRTLVGHTSWISSVALTVDGRLAVSASNDQTLKVWDLSSGRELRTLRGHTGPVNDVAMTPDGRLAISASDDHTLQVWEIAIPFRKLATLKGHTGPVFGVAVTPDGRLAASASYDTTLKVWELKSGKVLHTLSGHTSTVLGVAMTADGRLAISASADKTLKVWDLDSGREVYTMTGHLSSVKGVAVTPDGRLAVSASQDVAIKVWDLENKILPCSLAKHEGYVHSLSMTSDGRLAISASDNDKTLKVWNLLNGQELRTLTGHTLPVSGGVTITADGHLAISASRDQTIKVWDIASGQQVKELTVNTEWINSMGVTPDGRLAITSSSLDKTIKVWDLACNRQIGTLTGHASTVTSLAMTADGRLAISGSLDKTLKVWDLSSNQELCTLAGHADGIHEVAVSADGHCVISASSDKTLKVWSILAASGHWRGQMLHTLTGHTGWVNGAAITPDGRMAVSVSSDETLRVWDLVNGNCLVIFRSDGGLSCCSITTDGLIVVCAGASGRVHILNFEGMEHYNH